MAKRNYVYLSDNAFHDNYDLYLSDDFKNMYCSEANDVYNINTNYGTFTGKVSGNTYPIEEIGARNDDLFKNAKSDTSASDIYVNLNIPETVKRINSLGCQNLHPYGKKVNTYATYLAGLAVIVIPETVDEIEDNAFNGFQMVNVEDPTKYSNLANIGADYINAYTYSDDNVFYKNAEHTIIYGFIPDFFMDGNYVSNNVITIPNTITEIYSFTGEKKDRYSLINSSIEKVIIPTTITSIGDKLMVMSNDTITFSYNGVDYTAAGTGNNDSYVDLNNVLDTAGITTDGLLNIVQA